MGRFQDPYYAAHVLLLASYGLLHMHCKKNGGMLQGYSRFSKPHELAVWVSGWVEGRNFKPATSRASVGVACMWHQELRMIAVHVLAVWLSGWCGIVALLVHCRCLPHANCAVVSL